MRKLTNGSVTVECFGWLMTRNVWEYYLLDDKFGADIRFALVYGDETEMGDISTDEVRPHMISSTLDLTDVVAPPGWEWAD
jgi:hypothetical protein